jgi:hypothetical protein
MRDSGELSQEFTQGMATFKIVDEILERTRVPRKQGVPLMTSESVTITRSAIVSFIATP